jgi:hypothetical protein
MPQIKENFINKMNIKHSFFTDQYSTFTQIIKN